MMKRSPTYHAHAARRVDPDKQRLAEAGIEPSFGSVGDSDDNARAETINGLFEADEVAPG